MGAWWRALQGDLGEDSGARVAGVGAWMTGKDARTVPMSGAVPELRAAGSRGHGSDDW